MAAPSKAEWTSNTSPPNAEKIYKVHLNPAVGLTDRDGPQDGFALNIGIPGA